MKKTLLVMDDSKFNRSMITEKLQDTYSCIEAEDGKQLLTFIQEKKAELCGILLDPFVGSIQLDLLKQMAEQKIMEDLPVIIMTAQIENELHEKAYELGVIDIVKKPLQIPILKSKLANYTKLYAQRQLYKAQALRQGITVKSQDKLLQEQAESLKKSNENIIDILGAMVEYRNLESDLHIKRVKKITDILAHKMLELYPGEGLTEEKIRIIVSASALHDVGKILIPDAILLKPGKYTEREFEYMKSHTIRGGEIIGNIKGVWDEEYAKYCFDICRYHHERYDGGGYPDQLVGDATPLWAQIVAIADVFDALISDRVYKRAYPLDEAFMMVIQGECGVFSPKLLECFRNSKQAFETMIDNEAL